MIGRGKPLASVTTASLSALRKYTEAGELEEAGERLQAVALLEEALKEDSTFAMAHRRLAVSYGNQSNTEKRRFHAQKAHEYSDRLTDEEQHLAAAYYYNVFGETDRAILEYEAPASSAGTKTRRRCERPRLSDG